MLPGRPDLLSPTLGSAEAVTGNLRSGELQVPLCAWVPPKWDMLSALRPIHSKPAALPPQRQPWPGRPGACQLWALEGLALPPPWTVRGRRQLPADSATPHPRAGFGVTVPALGPGSRKAARSASIQLWLIHLLAQPT